MKTNKEYVLACAKAQGKISKLLWYYGEGDSKRVTLQILMQEIEALKQVFLLDEPDMKSKITNFKKTRPFYVGSCYTDPFAGWGGLNTPTSGWPSVVGGGVVVCNQDGTDVKSLPFGKVIKKEVPLRGVQRSLVE